MSASLQHSLQASPTAMFDAGSPMNIYNKAPASVNMWNSNAQTPSWQNDFTPNGLATMTPSPIPSGNHDMTSPVPPAPLRIDHSQTQLLIHPTHAKSRVETQINIKMTLQPMPPGVKKLHLPTQTISKPKLLAKDAERAPDTLELYTSLVCTSAMEHDALRQRAMRRAQGIVDKDVKIPIRRSSTGDIEETTEQDPNSPQNGGEVKICENCQNRERKRAGRKRQKKQEDEETWMQYQADRVIVFNTSEYQEWKQPSAPKEPNAEADSMNIREDAMQVDLPMRIACYCRHQGEKIGFQCVVHRLPHRSRS